MLNLKRFGFKRILLTLLSLFILWNVVWFSIITIRYKAFTDAVPKDEYGIHAMEKDSTLYYVAKPSYLRLSGNLTVSSKNKQEVLFIWPKITGGYKYGIMLRDKQQVYQIYIDKNINIAKESRDKVTLELVEKNKEEIKELFNRAESLFNI